MSGQLQVSFAEDMPDAAVEVISPDLEVVDRFMLTAGRSHTVEVPSERSFLRVHLPSGKVVTLQDPGSLERQVSMGAILAGGPRPSTGPTPKDAGPESIEFPIDTEPSELPSKRELFQYHVARTNAAPMSSVGGPELPLASFGMARLTGPGGDELMGFSASRGREAHWEVSGQPTDPPYRLRIEHPWGGVLDVNLPASVVKVWARADEVREQGTVSVSIRIRTRSEVADTIASYLCRGDLYSAESMAEWGDEAVAMVHTKTQNPYAAAVGAYLLLKLKRESQMRDWGKNLADGFPNLSDGCVVWAAQLMQRPSPDIDEIRRYLLEAALRGLPTFTEGLRLLTDGLRLLGEDGRRALDGLRMVSGVVFWDSPVTSAIATKDPGGPHAEGPRITYDIAFAARA